MLLQNKNAVIYGSGGSLGGAVARALAAAGAYVFATGRNLASVKKVVDDIVRAGGKAEAAEVDALNPEAVNAHLASVIANAGSVDISYTAINLEDVQGKPLFELALEDFTRPISRAMNAHFITATAAAKAMIRQGAGVILSLTATPGGVGYPFVGGFGPACCAIESFSRDLASEVGPYGVRAVNIRSAGSLDSRVFIEGIAHGGEHTRKIIDQLKDDTMLKAMPAMADIANTAVFLASDMAAKITGVTIDVTCGTTNGLNYKAAAMPFGQ